MTISTLLHQSYREKARLGEQRLLGVLNPWHGWLATAEIVRCPRKI